MPSTMFSRLALYVDRPPLPHAVTHDIDGSITPNGAYKACVVDVDARLQVRSSGPAKRCVGGAVSPCSALP